MPVSRKRKKKVKSGGKRSTGRPQQHANQRGPEAAPAGNRTEVAQAFQNLAAYRADLDRQRSSRAAMLATKLVGDLARTTAEQPDVIVSDAACDRLGAVLAREEQSPVGEGVGPHHLADALPAAAEAAVTEALTATTSPAHTWRAPWRVLTALTQVLSYPHIDAVVEATSRLRDLPNGGVLPASPPAPDVTGPVLWTSDRYGSRFAVIAPITTAEEPVRWYLWDIDACGHDAFTVHSAYYPSSDTAFTAWQTGVGETASAGTVLAPADDRRLLASLLPAEMGIMRPGGESPDQLAEYHRSKRLAEVVIRVLPRADVCPDAGLTAATAAVEFAAWHRAHTSAHSAPPENLDELAGELAESWNLSGIDTVYTTCSPHRVALCLLHMRDYYLDDFAEELVTLLPDWTRWQATRSGIAQELADRSLAYAHGRPHPQLGQDDREVGYLARVIE